MSWFQGKKSTVYESKVLVQSGWSIGFWVAKCNFLWGNIRVGGGKQVFETPLMMFQIHHETIFFGGEIVIYELCST